MTDKIDYPLSTPPTKEELIEVAPHIFWLRMSMPFALDHINLWLIEDEDYWTIVDTGLQLDNGKEQWLKIVNKHLNNKPIKQVLCTHMHPDHIGLAGWLCDTFSAELLISKGEYEACQNLVATIKSNNYSKAHDFYKARGLLDSQLKYYDNHIKIFETFVSPLPKSYSCLFGDQKISLGGYVWQVVIGKGHSPEHVCLWCESLNIIISGDQLLPTISSNISVYPEQPDANPLDDWLLSCHKLKSLLNNLTLVLPAHGLPFNGAIFRLEQSINEIEQDLENLTHFCTEPRRMVDTFSVLFNSEINNKNLIMACGESQAHLSYLAQQGVINIEIDEHNIIWHQKI